MTDAVALALLHFLWQGSALAALAWCALRLARTASVRYAIGIGTLTAMLVAPVATMVVLLPSASLPTVAADPADGAVSQASVATPRELPSPQESAATVEPTDADVTVRAVSIPSNWIVSLWLVGVVVLCVRFAGGWLVARRLVKTATLPVSDELRRLAAEVSVRLQLKRIVDVCVSSTVAVPVMVGWLRPVILLPPAALAGLSLAQIEALLAHECAHIRRHDYLVNLLQAVVETMCFYHPAVWWMSAVVRREREHCCDDLAVGVCDRLTYVTTLASLATLSSPRLALAATDGSLRERIRRLTHPTPRSESAKGGWIAMLPILLVVSLAAPHAFDVSAAPANQTPLPQAKAVPASVIAKAEPTRVIAKMPAATPSLEGEQMTAAAQAVEEERRVALVRAAEQQAAEQAADENATSEAREMSARLEIVRAQQELEVATVAAQDVRAQLARAESRLSNLLKVDRLGASHPSVVALRHEISDLEVQLKDLSAQVAHARSVRQSAAAVVESPQSQAEQDAAIRQQQLEIALYKRKRENAEDSYQSYRRKLAQLEDELSALLNEDRFGESHPRVVEKKRQIEEMTVAIERAANEADTAFVEGHAREIALQHELLARDREQQMAQDYAATVNALEMEQARALRERTAVMEQELAARERLANLRDLDADAALMAGDRVSLTVAEEPTLPKNYEVGADGAIRVPFLGTIRVQGSTTAQVASALATLIKNKGLGDNPTVTVTAMRERQQ